MIIGITTLIILLFAGGGGFSFDMFKDAAGDVISDRQIVRQVKAVTEAADDEMKAWQKDAKEISKRLAEMNRDYELTPAEMNTFIDYADSRREAFQEKLIDLRFQAKNLMSQEEWEAMYAKVTTKKK